jgi:hypothetical protein
MTSSDGVDAQQLWDLIEAHAAKSLIQRTAARSPLEPPRCSPHIHVMRSLLPPSARPVEREDTLYIALRAYRAATGKELHRRVFAIRYPDLDPEWDFNFDDRDEMTRRLSRLTALFLD